MPEVLSTDAVRPSDRFAFWREAICRTFVDGRFERGVGGSFEGRILSQRFDPVLVSEIASEAQVVLRESAEIARSPRPYYLVLVQMAGTGRVAQHGREVLLQAGDATLVDTLHPYSFHFTDAFRQLCVMLPQQCLQTPLHRRLSSVVARQIRRESLPGRLCRSYVATLCDAGEPASAEESTVIADNLIDLLGLAVATADSSGERGLRRSAHELDRARALILRSYADDQLTPGGAAADLGYSVRKLHQLFHEDGTTFRRYLTDVRLASAARRLTRDAEPIAVVAYDCGFRDLSHFCRLFRARYGSSPRDYRAARATRS